MKSFNNLYFLFLVLFIVGIAEVGLGQTYEIDDGTGANFTPLTTGKIVCPFTVYTIQRLGTGGRHWVANNSDVLINGGDGTIASCGLSKTVEFTGAAGATRVIDISVNAGPTCSAGATQTFSFNVQPLSHPVFASPTDIGCTGQSLDLEPTCASCTANGATYQWSENSTSSFVNVSGATGATYSVPSADVDAITPISSGTVDYRLRTTTIHGGGIITCIDNVIVTVSKEATPSLSAITFNSGNTADNMCTNQTADLEVVCTGCDGSVAYNWEYNIGANAYATIPNNITTGSNDAATITLGGRSTLPEPGRYDLRVTATNGTGCAATSTESLNQLMVKDLPGVEIFHNFGAADFTGSTTSADGEVICTGQELQFQPAVCTGTAYDPLNYTVNQSNTTAPNVTQTNGSLIDYQSPCRIAGSNFFDRLTWSVTYPGGNVVIVSGGGTLVGTEYIVNTPNATSNIVTFENTNVGVSTYSLTVLGANGCENSDDITVDMQDAVIGFTYPADGTGVVTDASGSSIEGCEGTSVSIDAVCADCALPSTYNWTVTGPTTLVSTTANPAVTNNIGNNTTTYDVVVTGDRGCIGTGTIDLDNVTAPNVTAVSINSTLCSNVPMRLNITGYDPNHHYEIFRGTPATGVSVYDCTSPPCGNNLQTTHNPINNETYYLVSTIPGGSGCSDEDNTGIVSINPAPNLGGGYAPAKICNDRPYSLYFYNFSSNSGTAANFSYYPSISGVDNSWYETGTLIPRTGSFQVYTLDSNSTATDTDVDLYVRVVDNTTSCQERVTFNTFEIINCEEPRLRAYIDNVSPSFDYFNGFVGDFYDYNYVCEGGEIELSVFMGASAYTPTFLWSSGETTQNLIIQTSALTPDTVRRSVEVFDENNDLVITLYHTFYVSRGNTAEYYPTDEAFGNDTSICVNETLLSQARCEGCRGDLRYLWRSSLPGTAENDLSINGSQFENYIIGPSTSSFTTTLTLTHGEDYRCRDIIERTIGVNTLPVIGLTRRSDNSQITTANPIYLCVGESDSLIVNCTTCSSSDFQWNTGATTPSIYLNNQGGYYAQVQDQNGCRKISELAVVIEAADGFNAPAVANPSQICSGNAVTLEVAPCIGCSYQWIDVSSGLSLPPGQTRITSDTGNYYAQVINAQGCYYNTAQVSVSETNLAIPSINGTTDSICGGQYATLFTTSGGGLQYQWYWNGGGGSTFTPIGGAIDSVYRAYNTGSYQVNVIYSNGCIGESPSFTVSSASFTPSIANSGFVICRGETVDVSTPLYAGWQYQWFRDGILIPGATGSIYSADSAGSYYAEVTNYNLCVEQTGVINLTSTSLSKPNATTSTPTVCPGEFGKLSVSLCSGCSYEWFNDDGISVSTNSTLGYNYNNVGVTDNYYAVITNNGCSENSDTVSITINTVFTPAISSSSSIVCNGRDATLVTQGCVGCSYSWLKDTIPVLGSLNDTFHIVDDIREAGDYQIAVDYPNGCSDTSAVLTINNGSYNVTLVIDPGGPIDSVICNGAGETLLATPDENRPGTYSHTLFLNNTPVTGYSNVTSGAAFNTFPGNNVGVYTVEVINPKGCKSISNLLPLRAVDISPTLSSRATSNPNSVTTTAICTPTGTAYLEVDVVPNCPSCTYEWRKGGTIIIPNSTIKNYTTNTGSAGTGLYIVQVTDDGCTASSNPISIANSIGTLDSEANTTDTSICNGQSVTLEHAASMGNPSSNCVGCSFRWLRTLNPINGASNYQYVTSTPGVYNLEVTTSGGCVDTSSIINVREVNPPAGLTLDFDSLVIITGTTLGTGTPLASNGSIIDMNKWVFPPYARHDLGNPNFTSYFTSAPFNGALSANAGLQGTDSIFFQPEDSLSGYHLITYYYDTLGCRFTVDDVLEVLPPASISVTNLNPVSVAYEACVGDALVINTVNLDFAIDQVFAFDVNDNYLLMPLNSAASSSDTFGLNIRWSTDINLTVQGDVYASYLMLVGPNLVTGNRDTTFTSFVLIHNTDLSFTGLPNMLCSNGDGTTLFGSPTGGSFYAEAVTSGARIAGAFVGDTLYPQQLSQGAYVNGSQFIDVYYSYRETYTNGNLCPADDIVSIRKEVRDVRLTDVQFNTISVSQTKELLTNLVYQTTPYAARPNKQPLYTSSFRGSFTNPAGNPREFLPANAGVGTHALTYRIRSGDCLNSVEDSITVVPAPTPIPMPDTICRNYGTTPFARQIAVFPYGPPSTFYPPNTALASYTDELNILNVTGAGVTAVNTTVGNESYTYNPTIVAGNYDTLIIEYGFYRHEEVDSLGTIVPFDTLEYVVAQIIKPIYIEDLTPVNIVDTIVSSFYCQENTLHLLAGNPSSNAFGGGQFMLYGGTNQYQFGDTLFNSVINPYDVNHLENATTTYDLVYVLNGAACNNSDTMSVTIGKGLNPAFATANGLDEFCDTDPNVLITHNVLSPDTAIWSIGGVPQPSYVFGPDPLAPGIHVVELQQLYTYIQATDTFVCSASAIDTFTIHALPALTMTPGLDKQYCANDTLVDLVVGPTPGCPVYAAPGHVILDEKFNSGIPPSWNSTYNFGGKNWTGATSLPQGGTGGAAFIDTSQVLNDSWLVTKTLDLVAGHRYRLTYMVRAGALDPTCSGFCDASLVVAIGPTANPASMGTQLDFQPAINNDLTYVRYVVEHYHDPLAGFVTGSYNLGFRSVTTALGRSLRLDNVRMRDMTLDNCSLEGIGYMNGLGVHNVVDSAYQFNPLSVPTGNTEVKYVYTDVRGCQDSLVFPITVDTAPIVSFTDLPLTYCENEPTLLIAGSPLGGLFTSTMGTNLVPVGLAVLDTADFPVNYQTNTTGTDIVSYRFEDNNGCSETVHDTIDIVPLLDSMFISSSLDPFGNGHCVNADSTILDVSLFSGTAITNGIFYGSGVRNGAAGAGAALFYPDSAEIDMGHTGDALIEYIYNTTTGCADTTRFTTRVHALPDLSFMNLPDSLCLNADSFQVVTINHVVTGSMGQIMYADTLINNAGQFIARDTNGVQLPNFIQLFDTLYPYEANGYSQVNVTYSYTASNTFGACSSTLFDSVRIDSVPQVYFQNLSPYYCENERPSIFLAFPAFSVGSGYLSIDSVRIDSSFFWINPGTMVGPGMTTAVYPTYYTFTDSRGCRGEAFDTFEVRPYPRITFNPTAQDTFCRQVGLYDLRQLLIAPIGGYFTDNLALTSVQDSFYLNLNSLAGPRLVVYNYVDPLTLCQNQDSIWLYLFNSPEIDFTVYGGCAQMDITFDGTANNLVSGIDSITMIRWDFEGNGVFINSHLDTSAITIPDTTHLYSGNGTYNVTLNVQNQGSCVASITKPLIVSPYYNLAVDYFEDFDNGAGDWYDNQPISVTPSNVWTHENSLTSNFISNSDGFWVTMAADPYYEISQSAWVYSPCFDFTTSQRPMIAMDLWRDVLPGIDGAVLEFYNNTSNQWELVGNVGEGIDWYQSDFVLARPGNQLNSLFPSAWTGRSNGSESVRLRLDRFKGQRDVRFRVAFATSSQTVIDSTSGNGYEGVAFDNVWIGERTRNVLVEHFDHVDYVNPNSLTSPVINQSVYNKIFNSVNGLDVILVQYQTDMQGLVDDPLYLTNPADLSSRQYQYSAEPNNIFVDGRTIGMGLSESLNQWDLDYDMLQFPDFDIQIATPVTIVNGVLSTTATVEALTAKDSSITYTTRVAVIQDSFTYVGNSHILSAFRKMLPNNAGTRKTDGWQLNEQQFIAQSLTLSNLGQQVPVNESQLEVIVFVQNADDNSREVFQAATTQDLNRYTGTTQLEDDIATEIFKLNVYPNPSSDLFNVEFDKALEGEYQWRLVDVTGRVLQVGSTATGTEKFTIDAERLVDGAYFFIINSEDNRAYAQRKLIVIK
jgi:hypothetical protein